MRRLAMTLTAAALALAGAPGTRAAAPPAGAPGAQPDTPIPITSLVSDSTARFKIYAPDPDALRLAYREMSSAAEGARRYIGEYSPPLTVAVLGTLSDPSRVDHAALRAAGVTIIADDWPPPPDLEHERARRRPAASPFAGPTPLAERAGRAYVRLYENLNAQVAVPPGRQHLVPDWFEAAIGGLVLSPAQQNARSAFMRDRLDQRIPLDRLFAMARPPASAGPGASAGGARRRGAAARAIVTREIFDAQSLALARFIVAREDARFLGDVLRDYLAGHAENVSLNKAQNIFPRPDALEKDWVGWMKTQQFPH